MFGIDNDTKLQDFTRLPSISAGSEVTVLLTAARDTRGTKGHYAIFEGKISEVHKGDAHVKGEAVKVLMVRLDESRRVVNGTNYAQIEVMEFLQTANGGKFPKENIAGAVQTFCKNIEGVAVKVIARTEGEGDSQFVARKFVSVPNQDLAAQRKLLASL
jgi:hypothetical protein